MTEKQKAAIDFLKTLRNGDKVDWDFLSDCQNALATLVEEHEGMLNFQHLKIKELEDELDQLKSDNGL